MTSSGPIKVACNVSKRQHIFFWTESTSCLQAHLVPNFTVTKRLCSSISPVFRETLASSKLPNYQQVILLIIPNIGGYLFRQVVFRCNVSLLQSSDRTVDFTEIHGSPVKQRCLPVGPSSKSAVLCVCPWIYAWIHRKSVDFSETQRFLYLNLWMLGLDIQRFPWNLVDS